MRRSAATLCTAAAAAATLAAGGAVALPEVREEPLVAYVRTYAPADPDTQARVAEAARIGDAAESVRRLAEIGEPARRALVSLAASRPDLEPRAAAVRERLGPVHAEVARRGLDHDVAWLAEAGDAGAARLRRILPAEAPRDDAAAWWSLHGRGYRWDPTSDRFVPAPPDAVSLRLRERATVRLADSASLVGPGSPFTLELWWRSADAATEIYLAGDEGWPELSTGDVRFATKCGWVLRRIPAGPGAAILQFCAAVAPDDWWAVASLPLPATQQWEHLALVCGGDAVRIFRDGECVAAARCDDRRFLASPTDLFVGPRNDAREDRAWARRLSHHDLRGVRLSEGARYAEDFVPPGVLVADARTLALLEFARGAERLADATGRGHDGVHAGGLWTGPLDPGDVRRAMAAIGANVGDTTLFEAERGAASADWWVSERERMSDGFIRELWSDRDPDALGHWAKVPLRVPAAGKYRLWYLGGALERSVGATFHDYSPFTWRIDEGAAETVAGGVPTVAGRNIEGGLSALGTVDLWAGEHVFELRLRARRTTDNHWSLWFDGIVLERLE